MAGDGDTLRERCERYRDERDRAWRRTEALQEELRDLRADVDRLRHEGNCAEDRLATLQKLVKTGKPPRLTDERRKTHRGWRHSRRHGTTSQRARSAPVTRVK